MSSVSGRANARMKWNTGEFLLPQPATALEVALSQVPERGLGRLLLVDLLQGLGQALLQRQGWVLLRALEQRLERWLLRDKGRVLLRTLEQRRERVLLQFDERRLGQGLHIGLMRGLLRLLLRVLAQRLQRLLEQGLLRAKALPLPSGGRPKGRDEGKEGGGSKWVMTQ